MLKKYTVYIILSVTCVSCTFNTYPNIKVEKLIDIADLLGQTKKLANTSNTNKGELFIFSSTLCLFDELLTNAEDTGTWGLIEAPSGSNISLQGYNPCIDISNQPYGLYKFEYTICKIIYGKEICKSTLAEYYHINKGEIVEGEKISICDTTTNNIILNDLFNIVGSNDMGYSYNTNIPNIDTTDINSISFNASMLMIQSYYIEITTTPMPPEGFELHPNCFPDTFAFEIELESCCGEKPILITSCIDINN